MKKILYVSLAILSLGLFSCEKMLNYPPDGAILAEDGLQRREFVERGVGADALVAVDEQGALPIRAITPV